MDWTEKHAALTAELQDKLELRQRALKAADDATIQIARLEGALSVVKEAMTDGES